MTAVDNDQEDAAQRALQKQRELDAIDFNLEITGQEPVRMRRFVPLEETPKARKQREAEKETRFLLNLASQQAIEQFQQRLDELDRASKVALSRVEARIAADEEALIDMRGRASRAPDGRLVFRTRDGSAAYYEDENSVEDLDAINWQSGAPDWENYKELRDRTERSKEERDRIGEYRDRLDTVREKVSSGDALTEDELSELKQLAEEKPESVRATLDDQNKPVKGPDAAISLRYDSERPVPKP